MERISDVGLGVNGCHSLSHSLGPPPNVNANGLRFFVMWEWLCETKPLRIALRAEGRMKPQPLPLA